MPTGANLRNPHDRFFKKAFQHHVVAAAEISRTLEPQILRHLDLGHMTLDDTSLLDEQMAQLFFQGEPPNEVLQPS